MPVESCSEFYKDLGSLIKVNYRFFFFNTDFYFNMGSILKGYKGVRPEPKFCFVFVFFLQFVEPGFLM